jgi:hypothetical protein
MRNFLIIALLASTTVSHAATIGFTGVGPGNIFNYNLTVSNERVMAGDFFVIYDFAGAISAAGPSADWASFIGSDSNLANDLTISDVRFTYSGTTITSSSGSPANEIVIPFTITSLISSTRQDDFYSLTTNKNNTNDIVVTGTTTVAGVDQSAVPEPATMAFIGFGLVGFTLLRRRGFQRNG